MTKIKIEKLNSKIVSIECDGHTGYGIHGEDIVCASLSSIVQTAALGLLSVVGLNINLKRDDAKGILKMQIPQKLTEIEQIQTDAILNTMILGISDLREGYSDFIEMEVITK